MAGPTAVGKTAVAIQIAQYFKTEIISADSRQCYHELAIGVAKPSPAELAAVPHYFINSHSITQQVDAAGYEKYALKCLEAIFSKQDTAVIAGGTGLYIKALCEGLDVMPEIPAKVRQQVRNGFYENGISWLQQEVERLDPLFYRSGEIQNPHRLMRAMEFVMATGESIKTYQKGRPENRYFNIIKIGLELPREILGQRINARVDQMMHQGLPAEVQSLMPYQNLKALQTVGYSELFAHFNGLCSMDAAVEFIKRNTRQYAKRQMTWFKKDPGIEWFLVPEELKQVIPYLEKRLSANRHG